MVIFAMHSVGPAMTLRQFQIVADQTCAIAGNFYVSLPGRYLMAIVIVLETLEKREREAFYKCAKVFIICNLRILVRKREYKLHGI